MDVESMFTRDRQDDFRAFCEHWGTLMKNTDYSATIKRHEDIIEEYRLIQRLLRRFQDEDDYEVIIREWEPHNKSVADYILSKDGLFTMTACDDTEIEHLEATIELHEKAIESKREVYNQLVSDWLDGAFEYVVDPPVDGKLSLKAGNFWRSHLSCLIDRIGKENRKD